jgi:glycosyltransferase involved in cell wall biosynthesis
MSIKKLSVIIPVYQNSESLLPLQNNLEKIKKDLFKINVSLEIIYVDDGSQDESFKLLLKLKNKFKKIRIIKLTRNFGAVHAVKAGFKISTGDCVSVLAADLQDDPDLLVGMVKKWLLGFKFVVCERVSRDDPAISAIFSSIYYNLLKIFVLKNFPKGGFDLCLMDKEMMPYIINSAKNTYLGILAFWLGYKPEVIHYQRKMREHGISQWTFSKKLKVFFDVFLGFSVAPVRAITLIGILTSIFSFSFGFFNVVYTLANGNSVAGYTTIITLITFLLGLIILMLGILGEYLARIFDELNRRPEVVIEKIY